MFIRTKQSSSRKTAVQLVEGYRDPSSGKVRQRVIRHLGYADTDEELSRLKELGEYVKAELITQQRPCLFSAEEIAQMAIEGKKQSARLQTSSTPSEDPTASNQSDDAASYAVDDMRLVQLLQQDVTGIHEVYGTIFDQLGFDRVVTNPARKESSCRIIRDMVLARIASPDSKRGSVRFLSEHCGIRHNLDSVYKSMDYLDDAAVDRIGERAYTSAQSLFKEKINVLFYDATTLYFESFTEDQLRSKGFSKDHKSQETQILLSIFVTNKGIPVGYELFPGSTYEGHTLITALDALKRRFDLGHVVFVADSGMLNKGNLALLEKHGYQYIVGARLKNMQAAINDQLFCSDGYQSVVASEDEMCGKVIPLEGAQSLIITHSAKRARKDAHDRDEALEKLQKKLNKQGASVRSMISGSSYKKYLQLEGEGTVTLDEEKILHDQKWDGLSGVITNINDPNIAEVYGQYRGLWQVEETFRVSKHDLKIRPIYHWTEPRIRAHIALCFMALVCVRHLEYRVALTTEKMSPKRIRDALMTVGIATLEHTKDRRKFAMPFNPSEDARAIYRNMGLKLNNVPYLMT